MTTERSLIIQIPNMRKSDPRIEVPRTYAESPIRWHSDNYHGATLECHDPASVN